jgi:hypothetical protein
MMMLMPQFLNMKMMMELIQTQFSLHACPEQMPPPSTDQQPIKRGRGRPRKLKPPNSCDKPKRGRGRPPKRKDPPSNNTAPEPKNPT